MALKNQPNAIAGVAPMNLDPAEAMRMQQGMSENRSPAQSSLAEFVDERKQRRRPAPAEAE